MPTNDFTTIHFKLIKLTIVYKDINLLAFILRDLSVRSRE